ncbi:hypothetical protein J2W32_000306 [Variovorax boronicumulans]|uniref:hypothetical protein n=1 Tax=Variovorax boronicumulans TaxID=436515 RepID=UPI00277F6F1E|nr:hypothetical protein [Variovorax boronicumulans]MDQ0051277.1 hypothetical protein [Variovorax boronicumulans]
MTARTASGKARTACTDLVPCRTVYAKGRVNQRALSSRKEMLCYLFVAKTNVCYSPTWGIDNV